MLKNPHAMTMQQFKFLGKVRDEGIVVYGIEKKTARTLLSKGLVNVANPADRNWHVSISSFGIKAYENMMKEITNETITI